MSFATRYRLAGQGLADDAFAEWLAAQVTSTDPIELYLSGNQLTPASIDALERAAPGAPMLLSLSDNPVGDDGARILGARAWFASVGVLQLAGCGLGAAAVDALLGAESALSNVEDLDLARNGLGDEGVALLARAPRTATLTVLALDEVGLGDRGAAELAASPHVGALRSLSLAGNRLTASGIAALRASANLAECTLDFGTAE